jgi:hypothetical protein
LQPKGEEEQKKPKAWMKRENSKEEKEMKREHL